MHKNYFRFILINKQDIFIPKFLTSISIDLQQEENNNIPSDSDGINTETGDDLHVSQKSAQTLLEMRKFTIAAANPILAEKLSTPSDDNLQPLSNASRPQVAPLTPKIERGMYLKL